MTRMNRRTLLKTAGSAAGLTAASSVIGTPLIAQERSLKIGSYGGYFENSFKEQFLKSDKAYVLLHYRDGKKVLKEWNRSGFTQKSNVSGNLRSGYLRGWRDKGICRAEVSTNKDDLV